MSKKKSSVKKTAKKGVAQRLSSDRRVAKRQKRRTAGRTTDVRGKRAKDVGRKKAKATGKSSGQPGLPGKNPRDTNGADDPQQFQVPPVQIAPPDSEIQ